MTKRASIGMVIVLLLIGGAGYWYITPAEQQNRNLTLRFHPYVGDQPLALNTEAYKNPGGMGQFRIRDFQFFISNIQLSGSSDNLTVKDSYHLLRFDGEATYAEINLPITTPEDFTEISWGVGVDPEANGTIVIAGDLDPNNRMAWNWEVGYKFILLEGRLETDERTVPLVYHVGFDDNYKQQSLAIDSLAKTDAGYALDFKVDVLELFTNPVPLDMQKTPTVKFDPTDAKRIAEGFKTLISSHN